MELWIATGNKGKLREFNTLLTPTGWTLRDQSQIAAFTPAAETGKTFLENARLKAKALAAVKNQAWVLAEDSGLEVPGLNGLPGIHSARYAGPHAADAENRAKLLQMMKIRSPLNRSARFFAQFVLISPERQELVFEGAMTGTIASKETGKGGFGYDAVFIPTGEEKTLAELGDAYKNKNSHRFHATQALLARLRELAII